MTRRDRRGGRPPAPARSVPLTTIGRRSIRGRRIKTRFSGVAQHDLRGLPGKRDRTVEPVADPSFAVRLKHAAAANLPASTIPVTNSAISERIPQSNE